MIVVKTIMVAFQTKVNRSIFIACDLEHFIHLTRLVILHDLHLPFFEQVAANVQSRQNEHHLAEPLSLASYHVVL